MRKAASISLSFIAAMAVLTSVTSAAEVEWERVAPGYVAYSFDQRSANGPAVMAGHAVPEECEDPNADWLDDALFTRCLQAATEPQRCNAVGCNLYRLGADGSVSRLTGERDGYGFFDVALSRDESRISAVSFQGSTVSSGSRIWAAASDGSRVAQRDTIGALFSTAPWGDDGSFLSAGVRGRLFSSRADREIAWLSTVTRCTAYELFTDTRTPLVAGFSGTYRLRPAKGTATRIGPPAEAIWASRDGRFVALAASRSGGRDAEILLSSNGGRTWGATPFEDPTSEDQGARHIVGGIAADGAGNLWAAGGLRDRPGARIWRLEHGVWMRVEAPDGSHPFSDITVPAGGTPIVASLGGIFKVKK